MLNWLEHAGVGYIIGQAKNTRLNTMAKSLTEQARASYEALQDKKKGRAFGEFRYAAKTWKRERRVIARVEHSAKGENPRYVVTNLEGDAKSLYEDVYCQRGEMEKRIKEQQLQLFADRTSCHEWWPNQFRLLLSGLAHTLLEAIRRLALPGTGLCLAQCETIRQKLLKIGAVVLRDTRRVRLLLSSAYPFQDLFRHVLSRLNPG
jgi:hypothetical protein